MSRNLLSSFSEYRNNGLQPLAIVHLPSFLCGQTQLCPFHVWLHSLECIMSIHEQLNTVRLTVRRLLYLRKTKSKLKRAQCSVDYEPGIMSGFIQVPPLLSGVGEVSKQQ